MDNDIKVVLFDLGRVLMNIDFDAFPRGLGLDEDQRQQYDQLKIQQTVRQYETGTLSTDKFFETLHSLFHGDFSKENIHEAFDAIIQTDNREIISFVKSVRQHYRIAVLSNTCASHWEKVKKTSSVISLFPEVFTSFQLGAMKPDRIVFEKVCSSLNILPHEAVFIDDLIENVDGATSVGMQGIVFVNTHQLELTFQNLSQKTQT